VLDAVIAVLPAEKPLRYIEVHGLVEDHLAHPVPKSSVKNVLARNCQGATPRFARVGTGFYRMS
jgi:hypothetical protein